MVQDTESCVVNLIVGPMGSRMEVTSLGVPCSLRHHMVLRALTAASDAARCGAVPQPGEMGGVAGIGYLPLPARPVVRNDARRDAAPPSDVPMAERDVMVVRGGEGEAAAMGGVLSARGVGREAIVGARPPLGGHVLQRANVDDGLKPYVSAQRGSNKH